MQHCLQSKCPSADEWIKNIVVQWNILSLKKNEIMTFAATYMSLEIIILSEVNQTNIMISLTCGILGKKDTNELISKIGRDSRT